MGAGAWAPEHGRGDLLDRQHRLRLNDLSAGWPWFSQAACGAKPHLVHDPAADRPAFAGLTAARVNDITTAKQMPIRPGAAHVLGLGYHGDAWRASLSAAGWRVVTRLTTTTRIARYA